MKDLNKYIEEGWIKSRKHPTEKLWIYNYSPKTQFEKFWNDTTLMCRGLILNEHQEIVARPFPKLFNMEELQEDDMPNIPSQDYRVYEKMDGSLGIMYWIGNNPFISTRGSFESAQAIKSTSWLSGKYSHIIPYLNQNYTYLFEIIYPDNKIVVDYGAKEELVLLAVIETKTGKEMPLESHGFDIVKSYSSESFESLKEQDTNNSEGYVIVFNCGFRMKIKFTEYIRLHKLITQFSNISIWENLKAGKNIDELLERVPDEFYEWVRTVKKQLEDEYLKIEQDCKEAYNEFGTRKETAQYFLKQSHPNVLFSMLDKRDYSEQIWKKLRPTFSRPFRAEASKIGYVSE